ncbi:DUF2071 domain-containing protein [Micromonospora sp. KC213]|uniref:DUF2071 domain-containing protein n=1 Tax=Micromonospora sp. KC213 TaxID=2530378 RepID=UPI00104BEA88|nr:DUF2071 domain-containing protein [Micromonospora sp. KC213]TDC41661.1 hypothetical protein E1166_10690 [Micromonospora sp. KC213]
MRAPRLVSAVQRRLLVNYRTDPEVTARLLPAPLRPQVVNGWAVSGICLIRLSGVRLPALPTPFGLRSEIGAHRIAVEWDTPDGVAHGVYIPRRDTSSRLNSRVGGRIFPGWHHRSRFDVRESADELRIAFADPGEAVRVDVHVRMAAALSGSHLFDDVDQASEFFRRGATGFSITPDPSHLDGVELLTQGWRVRPVELASVQSTFFDDPARFPPGSAIPDCGLLMRNLPATWKSLPPIAVRPTGGPVTTCSR